MNSQRWNWRMRPGSNPGEAITPSPSKIWVGANVVPPSTSHPCDLLTGAVLTHPSINVTSIRVRLYQEIAIRRDASRRRARTLPCQSAVSCQWAGTLILGTGVHRGGVVADTSIADVNAIPSLSTDPSGVRQWMFATGLPEHLPRTWTWTACEGDRKKIWFLDMRYRVIAEAFHNDQPVAAARSFVTFSPLANTRWTPQVGRSRERPASCALPSFPALEFAEHFDNFPSPSDYSSTEAGRATSSSSSSSSGEDHPSSHSATGFNRRRRTAMVYNRPQADDTLRRPRCRDPRTTSAAKRSISLLSSRYDHRATGSTESLTLPEPPPSHTKTPSSSTKLSSFKNAPTYQEDFDDVTITTVLQAPSQPPCSCPHAQVKLTEQFTATIILVPKVSLSQLKVTAVLTEVIEITDDTGTRQVYLQHHHRMAVSSIPSAANRRQEVSCVAQMTAADKLFSADASFDFMRVSHRLDVSVSYERRRVLGGILFGEVAPAEHDLWDIVEGNGMKVLSSMVLSLRHGEKPDQQTTVPWLAVWGSTERIAAVGAAESRIPRRKPGWATLDTTESQTCKLESKIDALRSLAYANAGSRRREESPDGRVEEDLKRFPTFKVDEDGPLSRQSCPVCLEDLDGVVTMLPCLHAGHRSCFGRSQKRASVCPVCRLDLSPFVTGDSQGLSVEAA